jgi:CBS domain-containing protein
MEVRGEGQRAERALPALWRHVAGGAQVGRDADTVHGVMTSDVVTVVATDPVREAIARMLARDIGSVVVVEDGAPIGLFTERDLTRRILADADLLDRPVADVMSCEPVTVEVGTEVVDAFEAMNSRGIRRLPVVAGGRLVGIVTEGDLRRWVGDVAKD